MVFPDKQEMKKYQRASLSKEIPVQGLAKMKDGPCQASPRFGTRHVLLDQGLTSSSVRSPDAPCGRVAFV